MVFERLSKALKSAAPSSAGYLTVHDTQLDEAPKGLLDDAKGLAAVQPVRRADGKLSFIAYWSSQEDETLSGPVLRKHLEVSGTSFFGVAGEPITKPPPDLWGKVKDKAVPLLLSTVAVLAALEGLNNRYVALIAAPQFTVRFDTPVYNADEGDAVAASFTVENALTGVELSDISVATKFVDVGKAAAASIDMYKLEKVALPATKSRTYYMSLVGLPPGEPLVSADVTVKAGFFRRPQTVPANARVIVWPSEAQAFVTHKATRDNQNRADFLLTLRVGKAPAAGATVGCDLRFKEKLSVPANYWRPLGKPSDPQWVQGDEGAVLRVTWQAVPSRSTQYAQFSLTGSAKLDWKKVAADAEPMCSIT